MAKSAPPAKAGATKGKKWKASKSNSKSSKRSKSTKTQASSSSSTAITTAAQEEGEEDPVRRRAECAASFGKRHFLPKRDQAVPPILYSFPGSGNTWTRLLIDFATGVFSGTVLAGGSATKHLPGQGHCDRSVSVVKVHPQHYGPEDLMDLDGNRTGLVRCRDKGGIDGFERFILLTRNPFDAIWSEYRRSTSKVFFASNFNLTAFKEAVPKYAVSYRNMVLDFRHVRRNIPKDAFFNMYYEDMLDKDKRVSIMTHLVEFIGINTRDTPQERRARIECAFTLGDLDVTKRGSQILKDLEEAVEEGKQEMEIIITKEDAYPPEVACPMWAIFGAAAKDMGYTLPNGITEKQCERINQELSSSEE